MKKLGVSIVASLAISLLGCGTPDYVCEKIHTETKVHQGYLRLKAGLSREQLIGILEADAEAWSTLDGIVNVSSSQ